MEISKSTNLSPLKTLRFYLSVVVAIIWASTLSGCNNKDSSTNGSGAVLQRSDPSKFCRVDATAHPLDPQNIPCKNGDTMVVVGISNSARSFMASSVFCDLNYSVIYANQGYGDFTCVYTDKRYKNVTHEMGEDFEKALRFGRQQR